MQKASKIKHVKDVKGFGQLRAYQLKRWVVLADKPKRRRGRRVRQAFEEEVWAKLVICTLKVVDGVPVATVIHNVVYNFSIVKLAAKEIQGLAHWEDDVGVQNLKFSAKWVWRFLKRQDMKRRRITHEQKEIPTQEAVRLQMLIGQTIIIAESFLAAQIWNFDETGFTWAIAPQYAYVGKDARRGEG